VKMAMLALLVLASPFLALPPGHQSANGDWRIEQLGPHGLSEILYAFIPQRK